MSAIPYMTSWIFGIVFGNIADALLQRKYVSIVSIRKSAQIVGKCITHVKDGRILMISSV